MYIALMSHDNKKELMVQFCTAYAGILSRHNLCATSTTGQMIAEATGLVMAVLPFSAIIDHSPQKSQWECYNLDIYLCLGLTMFRQSRSPRSMPSTSISAVATLEAKGMLF